MNILLINMYFKWQLTKYRFIIPYFSNSENHLYAPHSSAHQTEENYSSAGAISSVQIVDADKHKLIRHILLLIILWTDEAKPWTFIKELMLHKNCTCIGNNVYFVNHRRHIYNELWQLLCGKCKWYCLSPKLPLNVKPDSNHGNTNLISFSI
jgi:hypothetical protein